jgi:cytoskeletal protein CcmA (bactofilin family)
MPAPPPRKKEIPNMGRDDRQTAEMNALLGRGTSFEGKLTFEGTVRIDGIFKGEIHTSDVLIIGETARVEAEVKVGTAIVNGEVVGNITAAQAVELHAPAKVRGNLATPSLLIEKGVVFEGACTMDTGMRRPKVEPLQVAANEKK